ncbi:MAG TPA: hypothetical protein PLA94_31630, partial [Myxococcota bacterium]|nr:hypothetical protein [Myxococcota bacterium]
CYLWRVPAEGIHLTALRALAGEAGATIKEVLRQCRWKYAPQLHTAAITSGAASRFEQQQGAGKLWITGASASHEAVDNIVDYNERLVERMELAFAGKAPSDGAAFAAIAKKFRGDLGDY